MNLKSLLSKIESKKSYNLRFGRQFITNTVYDHCVEKYGCSVLDIGCGFGEDLQSIKETVGRKAQISGIETYEPNRLICVNKNITTYNIDIEKDLLPFEDKSVDVVIINQVLEHCKEIFWVISEISRILKTDGLLIIGVPNLATWHDRLMLLLGFQPRELKVCGPHVRGFTRSALKEFVELDNYFKINKMVGQGFRPFTYLAQKLLAWMLPSLATSIFVVANRTDKEGTFIRTLNTRFYETNYKR